MNSPNAGSSSPRRIHEVTARQIAEAPDRIALVEDGASWSYRGLDQRVSEIATVDAGVDGIYCSNHGGRQANGGIAAVDLLRRRTPSSRARNSSLSAPATSMRWQRKPRL
jgi:hypothetical protein